MIAFYLIMLYCSTSLLTSRLLLKYLFKTPYNELRNTNFEDELEGFWFCSILWPIALIFMLFMMMLTIMKSAIKITNKIPFYAYLIIYVLSSLFILNQIGLLSHVEKYMPKVHMQFNK